MADEPVHRERVNRTIGPDRVARARPATPCPSSCDVRPLFPRFFSLTNGIARIEYLANGTRFGIGLPKGLYLSKLGVLLRYSTPIKDEVFASLSSSFPNGKRVSVSPY